MLVTILDHGCKVVLVLEQILVTTDTYAQPMVRAEPGLGKRCLGEE